MTQAIVPQGVPTTKCIKIAPIVKQILGHTHRRVCCDRMCALHHRYAPQAAIHAPSAKLISGESNIVEMLLQFPALLQHATATGADRNTAM